MIFVLYAAYVKLSAKILRSAKVSWKHSFIFSLMIVVLTLAGRAGVAFSGVSLPIVFGAIFALTIHLGLGGWFFSTRGMNTQGKPLGWRGGMQLIAITFAFLGVTVVSLQGLVHVIALPVQC